MPVVDLRKMTNLCGSSIIIRNLWSSHHDWENFPAWLTVNTWSPSTGHYWLSCPHSTGDQGNLNSGVPALPSPSCPSIKTRLPCNSLILLTGEPATPNLTFCCWCIHLVSWSSLAWCLPDFPFWTVPPWLSYCKASDKCFLVITFYCLLTFYTNPLIAYHFYTTCFYSAFLTWVDI